MASRDLAELEGVRPGRAHQLVAGALVAGAAMRALRVSELEICPWALREGVILRRLDTLGAVSRPERRGALTDRRARRNSGEGAGPRGAVGGFGPQLPARCLPPPARRPSSPRRPAPA